MALPTFLFAVEYESAHDLQKVDLTCPFYLPKKQTDKK